MTPELLQIVLLAALLLLVLASFFRKTGHKEGLLDIAQKLTLLENNLTRLENSVKEDFKSQRQELNQSLSDSRRELTDSIRDFKTELQTAIKEIRDLTSNNLTTINQTLSDKLENLRDFTDKTQRENRSDIKEALEKFGTEQKSKLDDLTGTLKSQLEKIESKVENKLHTLTTQAKDDSNQMRESIGKSLKDFEDRFVQSVNDLSQRQKEKLELVEKSQNKLIEDTSKTLENIRTTVAEKLEKTLSDRLGQSFETVSKQLNEVQRGLGEMQTIASEVGGLKKVLSNVKLRGSMGEVQLAMLLEQMLAPSQYEANVITKSGSRDAVEFALKLPGQSDDPGDFIYLPIDAKFPKDVYEQLLTAYDRGQPEEIDSAIRSMENAIRKMARDIRDKYIHPPTTTDFAILFLPFEGIYAEVIRRTALVDQLRSEFQITVAGPTTLSAILNSLQMGFRTLALQKRSSEVWKVLGAVKTEFEKFGSMLEKAQKNIKTGLDQLDQVAGTRTRAIQRRLRDIEALPDAESRNILPEIQGNIVDVESEDDHI